MKPKIIHLSIFCFLLTSVFTDNYYATEYNADSIAVKSNINKENFIKTGSQDSLLFAGYSENFKVVYRDDYGFVALDESGNVLFTIYPYDNGPDYPSDDLFRIIENGKIGFANLTGTIVINPEYYAALPFQNGLAAFCDDCIIVKEGEHEAWSDGSWGFINKDGEVVIEPVFEKIISGFSDGFAEVVSGGAIINIDKSGQKIQAADMNYQKWVELLGEATRLICENASSSEVKVKLTWRKNEDKPVFVLSGPALLEVEIILSNDGKPVAGYYIIPWQNFSIKTAGGELPDQIIMNQFVTVTDYAVIYKTYHTVELTKDEQDCIKKFDESFNTMIDLQTNQTPEEDESLNIPEGIQVISLNSFNNYLELNIALPGSKLPDQSRWPVVSEFKMLHLMLTPDIGHVKEMWVKPNDEVSIRYRQVENELQSLFEEAIAEIINLPESKNEIYKKNKDSLNELFSNAEAYSGFLYGKYSELLFRWLMMEDESIPAAVPDEMFYDYQSKMTPDTAADFMPEIADELEKIPPASIESFHELYNLLDNYKKKASKNPGRWEEGNIVLGAGEREYKPTRYELLASEVGDRLQSIISKESKKNLRLILKNAKVEPGTPEYIKFTFIHYDVMGSGRFFYVDTIEKVIIDF